MANDYRVIEEIKRLMSSNLYMCVVLSHYYTEHKIEECEFNRANLKGLDVAIYTILSQVFHSFVTYYKINAVIDEFESNQGNDDFKGTFCLVVFLLAGVISLCLCQLIDVSYVNKNQTLCDSKRISEAEINYGSCGKYDLNNQYYTCLVLLKPKISRLKNYRKSVRRPGKKRKLSISSASNYAFPNKKAKQ
ncbi:hypothetical protein RFI_28494 [Reticulomyxa filosa]|uniref:Uncharacterized protein n=1 Tax=Reticulomyxa filosa TaxID=46433 RepID=X6M4S5_RETFI|nr:hypothetical protein RFI_28494 [Reticulomyxa filosa]|eukprot:ETO08894.1 hypothetical protein RFI_28494 [Reticulomyxa filosa]